MKVKIHDLCANCSQWNLAYFHQLTINYGFVLFDICFKLVLFVVQILDCVEMIQTMISI